MTYFLILFAALITSCISGLFGMAGGMVFMGVIASLMGVAQAMIVHGFVQSLSNLYRFYLLRRHIRWSILGYELIGALPATLLFVAIGFIPNTAFLFLALGVLPALLWLPRGWLTGNAARPRDAMICGFSVMALNLTAGVAGPALDFFFVKTTLTRKEIVATKAITMFVSHCVKIIYFGLPLLALSGLSSLPPLWVFAAVIPCIIIGTFTGTRLLNRLSDIGFRSYTKYLVSLIGMVYLVRGMSILAA